MPWLDRSANMFVQHGSLFTCNLCFHFPNPNNPHVWCGYPDLASVLLLESTKFWRSFKVNRRNMVGHLFHRLCSTNLITRLKGFIVEPTPAWRSGYCDSVCSRLFYFYFNWCLPNLTNICWMGLKPASSCTKSAKGWPDPSDTNPENASRFAWFWPCDPGWLLFRLKWLPKVTAKKNLGFVVQVKVHFGRCKWFIYGSFKACCGW